ncbi:hypothetical protein LOZ80_37935 [Paenibacillus sp. HWE-109]|uniref:hypothetical protein n=1 Tax=Paenibacillus sp. HWE-109 TaxID=1306526 RepID=UPI001EDD1B96|nr:hypothetical protein [Paenibacillus sp. HWE-109]UKS27173.1 hypothetical protein LOZ80_37935 [Paenibacillus sp. HWE-109]
MIENPMVMPELHYWMPPVNLVLIDLSDLEPDIKDLNQKLLVKFRKEHGLYGRVE